MNEEGGPKENRLARWSSKKMAARAVLEKENADIAAAINSDIDQQALDTQHLQNREAAEAVDLDLVDYDSDFSVFMKDGVPDVLRRKAYRLLWRSNPVLANVDGLNDYDEDFADASMIMKTFKSAWDVKRGYEPAPEDIVEESDLVAEAIPQEALETKPSDPVEDPVESQEADAENSEDTVIEETSPEQPSAELTAAETLDQFSLDVPSRGPQKVSMRQRLNLDDGDRG